MKIKWLGHASFLIRLADKRVYIDPYAISGSHKPADLILLTHEHYEHCDASSIKKLTKTGTHILGSANAAKRIAGCGILRCGDGVHLDDVAIKAVPSYNIGKHYHPKGVGVGYVIEQEGKSIYHAGDTDLIPEMKTLKDITVALLPIGGTYTMNADEATEAAKIIKPKIAVPMHYGTVHGSRFSADRFKSRVEKETDIKVEFLEEEPLWI
jgi:L-ascorbate metabolism protein UlaG (beta-lactamase superfamily)